MGGKPNGQFRTYYLGMIEIPVFWMILISGPFINFIMVSLWHYGFTIGKFPAEPDEGSPRLTENRRFCHGCNTSLIQIHWDSRFFSIILTIGSKKSRIFPTMYPMFNQFHHYRRI